MGARIQKTQTPHLTRRQCEVLRLMAEEGLGNSELASRLHITPGTARVYQCDIYKVLGVRSDRKAIRWYWMAVKGATSLGQRTVVLHCPGEMR